MTARKRGEASGRAFLKNGKEVLLATEGNGLNGRRPPVGFEYAIDNDTRTNDKHQGQNIPGPPRPQPVPEETRHPDCPIRRRPTPKQGKLPNYKMLSRAAILFGQSISKLPDEWCPAKKQPEKARSASVSRKTIVATRSTTAGIQIAGMLTTAEQNSVPVVLPAVAWWFHALILE